MKNESFVCEWCGRTVPEHPEWSARNHCPHCMASKHVDADFPGDRASDCGGKMPTVDFENRRNRGLVAMHECEKCGKRIANKLAPDDEYLPLMRTVATKKTSEFPRNAPH